MISNFAITVFLMELVIVAGFAVWCIRIENAGILHHLYLSMLLLYAVWVIPLIFMKYVDKGNTGLIWLLDSITSIGAYTIPAIFLCISLVFVRHEKRLRKWMLASFVIPVINVIIIFTNPWHHLQYEIFSVVRSEIEFGPYIFVTGGYSYLCLVAAIIVLLVFAIRNNSRLYWKQVILLVVGAIPPMAVNYLATFSSMDISIAATPMCFAFVIILHGIAIYQGHLLDIRPIAIESIPDTMLDAFVVLSKDMLTLYYNRRFKECFAEKYDIAENRHVRGDEFFRPVMENIGMVDKDNISYEYDCSMDGMFYSVKITAVVVSDEVEGYIVIFRDVTELAKSIRQLEESRERLIRQEKLALLGQMTAGLAHNLKSPIMGAAGCVSALEALAEETRDSIGDSEVTDDDYMEILGEADSWLSKIDESLDYMSDMISEIKDRAVYAMSDEVSVFPADEIFKSCSILMEHELVKGRCTLEYVNDFENEVYISGNMNTLMQAVNNLLSNAVYSQSMCGGGNIIFRLAEVDGGMEIRISDTGTGINEKVKSQLFKSMVTTKGSKGTGLGLYISDMTIRENYGGRMWIEDNEPKGVIACIFIPEGRVRLKNEEEQEER